MSGSVLLRRQRSPEDLHQLLAWYKIRDTLFGENYLAMHIKKALALAAVCQHPNAVWLAKLFGGRDVASAEEAREIFLGYENDSRALVLLRWCAIWLRCIELLILAMRLRRCGWQCKLMVKRLCDG
jgi:hypothetical protein